jgi:ribonuclease R
MTESKDASKESGTMKETVVRHMADGTYRPLKPKELARELEIAQSQYTDFRHLLREMLRSGEIIRLRRGRLALPAKLELIRGRVHANRKGFAFVIPEDGSPDIYIDADHVKTAMHDDIVLVQKLGTSFRGSPEGRVVRIVRRGHPKVVGTFQHGKYFSFVKPEDERLPRDIYVAPQETKGAQPGQIVVVDLSHWEDPARSPEGKIVEILGFPEDPGVDVLTVIHEHGLEMHFPAGVEAEAQQVPGRIPRGEHAIRQDCRDLAVVTIDPKDAKDHDDAVSVTVLPGGNYEVGVHIADVSYYVNPGTDLDREALLRGTSVYLVDRVIPMLPHKLSSDVCSLRAGVDRLTITCFMELAPDARLVRYRLAETVIQSAADMTYEEVQAYFDSAKIRKSLTRVKEPLDILLDLTQKLTAKRLAAGSLDFDLPESKIELGEDGSVKSIYEVARLSSHRLIEELMLLANQTVARFLHTAGIPTLYRVHDKPPEEKLKSFTEFVQSLGYRFHTGPELKPKHLQALLEEVKGRKEEGLVNEVLLRTMAKAVYQPDNIGHFGLAFDRYVHFTSPIRRYPDLVVHRAVRRKLKGKASPEWIGEQRATLTRVGRHTSERERVAMEAERDSVRIKQISFMETQLGGTFAGIVSGVRTFGLFVRLDKILIDGLIPIGSIGDDYYYVEEERYLARGRNSGRTFRLGDRVTVQVVRVDPITKQIDFTVVEGGTLEIPPSKPAGRRALRDVRARKPRSVSSRKKRRR